MTKTHFFIVFVHLIHLKHESYEYVINELASKSTPTSHMTLYLRKPLLLTMFHQTTFAIIIFHVLFRTFALWLGNRKVLLQTSTKLFLVDFLCVCVCVRMLGFYCVSVCVLLHWFYVCRSGKCFRSGLKWNEGLSAVFPYFQFSHVFLLFLFNEYGPKYYTPLGLPKFLVRSGVFLDGHLVTFVWFGFTLERECFPVLFTLWFCHLSYLFIDTKNET